LAFALVQATPSSSAQTSTAFSAVADARLTAVNFTFVPGIVFPQLIDAGSAVAQAELSSLGDSRSFASSPYPSESAVLLPGLVAGLTNGGTSGVVPEYPLVASSSHPTTPAQRVEAGSLVLDAASGERSTRGAASDGLDEATATVARDANTGAVVARAETAAASIRLSSLLSLDGVRSTAEARTADDGTVELTSSFDVGALVVAGQRLGLEDLLAGSGGLPDLGGTAAGLLLEQLAADGTTIEVLPAEQTEDAITSAGLLVRRVEPAPDLPPLPPLPDTGLSSVPGAAAVLALPNGLSGVEEIVTEVVIGRASARVDARALPGLPEVSPPVDAAGPATPLGAGAGSSVGSPARTPVPAATPRPASPAAPAGGQAPSAGPATALAIADIATPPFYAVLLIAGAACVGTVVLIGKLGVREP
jgi:hypothetical protein